MPSLQVVNAKDCDEAIREMLHAWAEQKRRNATVANTQTPLGSLPIDVARKILLQADENSLARLAQTCQLLHNAAEEYRFQDVSAWSRQGFHSLYAALTAEVTDGSGRTRAQRVQSLTLSWDDPSLDHPVTVSHIRGMLELVGGQLSGLVLSLPTPDVVLDCRQSPRLDLPPLPCLHALSASAAIISCLKNAPQNLTCLSVDRLPANNFHFFTTVSNIFSHTLQRLRVHRSFNQHFSRQSPVRICASLIDCRALVYLEVVDQAEGGSTGLDQLDGLLDNPLVFMTAAEGTPVLQTLVWRPAWFGAYAYDQQTYMQNVITYTQQLHDAVDPRLKVTIEGPRDITEARIMTGEQWDSPTASAQ
ncbi:hypothetical protein L226DRAFT_569131 [Lentinus tigrinus ALCF2SS1-7]|uniref:uncharacterized protein n=1 Tax=Lentinus tigrinus ALCF2SS1-7 TaxID=1328758 RepID=UPI0011660DEB|nr:hypothetical protein L226DRAFT_569131 [Lentinus tigrinus ALCF2SS1-7]